jgi:uncharacterized DUF497 family protein
MEFEFDPAKSSANRAKHAIDFVEAQHLIGDKVGTAVFALRSRSDHFGWRARKNEVERYEKD